VAACAVYEVLSVFISYLMDAQHKPDVTAAQVLAVSSGNEFKYFSRYSFLTFSFSNFNGNFASKQTVTYILQKNIYFVEK